MLKSKTKLSSISDVALKFGLVNKKNNKPLTHTLRFWETKFKQLKPTILAGGRRYYSIKDIKVVEKIYFLLKEQGMTLNGAKRVMNENFKSLDETKSLSIKAVYYRNLVINKSKKILNRIKKLNGKKNTY